MKNRNFWGAGLAALALVNWTPASGWGAEGHNAIAHIAQNHLSQRTKREVTRLLEGYNMAYWSAWADGLRDDHRYDAFRTWHYANADEGFTYSSSPKNPSGDVYTAVVLCVEQLSSRETSDSIKGLYLKLLIHFVGDMHCPMHSGHLSDRGGNNYAVQFFNTPSNLHRVWDSQLVDSARPWSGLEWAWNIDRRLTRTERRALIFGTEGNDTPGGVRRFGRDISYANEPRPSRRPGHDISDTNEPRPSRRSGRDISDADILAWMEQTVALSHSLYADTPEGGSISWPYINKYSPLVEQKFLEAGHRLASLLNQIFG
jgi:hypothetical protein